MILRKYGVELKSITSSDLEQVRLWRTDSFVQERMFFQDGISIQEQEVWFESLKNSDVYLIIEYKEREIGVINVKDIDFIKRTGEAGIFIGDKEFRQSFVPMLAILCLMNTFFLDFDFTSLTASLRADNEKALKFNLDLGYEITSKSSDQINLEVQKKAFLNHINVNRSRYVSFEKGDSNHSLSSAEDGLFRLK
jgi:RimJ/RimL family protein N-acetyltransferase